MAKPAIFRGFYSDEGTITSTPSAVATLPNANLQAPQIAKRARWTGTSVALVCDLGRNRVIAGVLLLGHNLTTAATWRVEISADAGFTSTAYDSNSDAAFDNYVWPRTETFGAQPWAEFTFDGRRITEDGNNALGLFSAVSGRYIRITVTDTENTDGYLQAGRLIVDSPWRPSVHIQPEFSIRWQDNLTATRSRGGQVWLNRQSKWRVLSVNLANLPKDEMLGQGYEMDRARGQSSEIVFVVDPDDTKHRHRLTVYGRIVSDLESRTRYPADVNLWEKTLVIEESK